MEEPLRVAQIIGKWVGGGVESVVMNYYRYIDKTKIQFDFFIDEDSTMEPPVEEIENLGGKVYKIPSYTRIIKYHKELKKLLKENNYKIVHSHVNTLSVFPLFAAKCAKVPVRIAHSHSTTNKKEWKKNIIKQILRPFSKLFATDYMCCSELAGRWLFGNKTYDQGKVYLLNNAIDLDKFKYDENVRKKKRKELEIKDDTLVIGHVGRFVDQKNHTFLIDIFNEVHKEKTDSILLLIGEGPLKEEIQNKVDRLNLTDSVKFLGQRTDVNELYQAMDVFVLPSLYEGLGMVLIEAQCSGLPCVVSTEVPNEVKLTDNIEFNCLKNKKNFWKKEIIKMYENNKNKRFKNNLNKYDIFCECIRLKKYYINKSWLGNEKMIKVLQTGMTDNLGGIEAYLINYYRHIDINHIHFDFLNIYDNKICFQDEIENNGGHVFRVTNYYKHPFKYIKEVKNIIVNNNYEIVHCNMNSAVMIWPLIAAKLAKTKVIIAHAHNSSNDKGIIKSLLHSINRHFIPFFANTYFACSYKAGEWFFNRRILNGNHFYLIYNAIDEEKFKYSKNTRKKVREKLNIKDNTFVIGHVGRFVVQKNHMFLIETFYEFQKRYPNTLLLLIGIGPLFEKMQLKVKKLGLSSSVKFLGQQTNVNELYQAMDIFLLPSLYEGLPLVGIEAQLCGLPCLFSNSITEEVLISNSVEFLDIHNKNKWVNKLYYYQVNKNLKISKINEEKEKFNIQNASKNLIDIYHQCLK